MPARQRGSAYRLADGRWGLRYYEHGRKKRRRAIPDERRRRSITSATSSNRACAARRPRPDLTFAELADVFLERHAAFARRRTIRTLRRAPRRPLARLRRRAARGNSGHERRAGRLRGRPPTRFPLLGHVGAPADARGRRPVGIPELRTRPRRRPEPAAAGPHDPRLHARPSSTRSTPSSAPTTADRSVRRRDRLGPRVGELERRDVDRTARRPHVRGTKTTGRAARCRSLGGRSTRSTGYRRSLDTACVFTAPTAGRSTWTTSADASGSPAVEASGVETPARIYDLRSTFASNALAAAHPVRARPKVMGTSVAMIERHYGALVDGAQRHPRSS